MTINIFSSFSSPRLEFVLDFFCQDFLQCDYILFTSVETYRAAKGPHLNYSNQKILDHEIQIPVVSLLFEKSIQQQNIKPFQVQGLPAFFAKKVDNAHFPFDLFALTFYLLSRYEEYLPYTTDEHQRFCADQSLAFQTGFLQLPLVDLWFDKLQKLLESQFPTATFLKREYQFSPTYDIDMAWAFLHKGPFRYWGALGKEIFEGNLHALKQRIKVAFALQEDPFFTFTYMDKLHKKFRLTPVYFFLVGRRGKYDKNISIQKSSFQRLIRSIAEKYSVGLHPSYQSNNNQSILRQEKENLEAVSKKRIVKSRQHFLKLKLPVTYHQLIEAGIEADYTMGYAQEVGFRASTSFPFYWYDLSLEKKSKLRIFPFAVMDVTLKQYLKLSPEKAIERVRPLIEITRQVGGTFSTLWHNNSLSETEGWQGWKVVYKKILAEASQDTLDSSTKKV